MAYPKKVSIVEVGPRDGFQSIKPWIETSDKIEVNRRLMDAGLSLVEFTSFISPKAISQMKDAAEITEALLEQPGNILPTRNIIALRFSLSGSQ